MARSSPRKQAKPNKFPLKHTDLPFIFQSSSPPVAIHPLSMGLDIENVADGSPRKRNAQSVQDDSSSIYTPVQEVPSKRLKLSESDVAGDSDIVDNDDSCTTQLPLPSPSASPVHSPGINSDSLQSDADDYDADILLSCMTAFKNLEKSADLIRDSRFINKITDELSPNNKNMFIYKILENLDRSTLSALACHMKTSLRFDIVSNLPPELSQKVFSFLDHKSLSSASQVSKNWLALINRDKKLWFNLIFREDLVCNLSVLEREFKYSKQLVEKYYTIPEKLYVNASPLDVQCFEPNLYRIAYKKYFMMNNNWNNPSFEPRRIPIKAHGNHVITCLQFDADKIVTGADDKVINVLETSTGKKLKVLQGHEGGVWGLKYVGNTLVTASTDKTLRVWNLKTGKCTHVLKGHNSTVRCLEIVEPVVIGKNDRGEDIVYPKTPILVSGSRDNNLNLWDLSMVKDDEDMNKIYGLTYTQEEIEDSLSDDIIELNNRSEYFLGTLSGHSSSVRSISVYGNIVVSGSYDTSVRVWDIRKKQCLHILPEHTSKVYATAIDHKRNRVLAGSLDSNVNIWDLTTGQLIHSLKDHTSLVGLVQLSDRYLATGAADTTVRIWDPETGEVNQVLEGHSGAITCFQHNDKRVVSGSSSLLMWNIQTGKLIRKVLEDTASVWQIKFNDKNCIAAVQKNEEAYIEILDFETPSV